MRLQKLTIQNFLSIRYIELNLEDQGLVLLQGINRDNDALNNNGAGKSSVIESLVYSLYGRTVRGLKGDDIVNRYVGRNTKVWLDLTDDDGSSYRIARYRKHKEMKNRSFIYHNGRDITPKSESDVNSYIADLLQADYLTFTSSLLYSEGSFKFTSATDSEMKHTFDVMLGLDIYAKCQDIAKDRLRVVLAEQRHKEDSRQSLLDIADQYRSQLSEAKADSNRYEQESQKKRKSIQSEIERYTDQVDHIQDSRKTIKSRRSVLNRQLDESQSRLIDIKERLCKADQVRSEVDSIRDEMAEYSRKSKSLMSESRSLDKDASRASRDASRASDRLKVLWKKLEDLRGTVGTPCPTCGKPLDRDSIASAEKELLSQIDEATKCYESSIAESNRLSQEASGLTDQFREYQDDIGSCQSDLEALEGALQSFKHLRSEQDSIEASIVDLRSGIAELRAEYSSIDTKANSLRQMIDRLSHELSEVGKDNPYTRLVDEYTSHISSSQENIRSIDDELSKLADQATCLQFWVQAYGNQGIKSYILDDITPFLNRRANKYLGVLSDGHIEVRFSTQSKLKNGDSRERFSISVVNADGGGAYTANSGGERKRVDLAINLAMQDLIASRSSKSINIAIFDEVFDALDQQGIERVVDLLGDLSHKKSSIFVISHNEGLQSYFTNIITVIKENGCSRLAGDEDIQPDDEGTD